jgi:hypothetical protein
VLEGAAEFGGDNLVEVYPLPSAVNVCFKPNVVWFTFVVVSSR